MQNQDKNGGPNYLRAWREFRGMTLEQLAEAVGTNPNMIGYLENGSRGLSAKWLRRLSGLLQTNAGMILEHDPNDLDNDILEIWANIDNTEKVRAKKILLAFKKDGTSD